MQYYDVITDPTWRTAADKIRKLRYSKDDRAMHAISGSNEPLLRYGHSKLSKMAVCRQLGFDVTRNSAIRSADPENPTLEQNMKCINNNMIFIRRTDKPL